MSFFVILYLLIIVLVAYGIYKIIYIATKNSLQDYQEETECQKAETEFYKTAAEIEAKLREDKV